MCCSSRTCCIPSFSSRRCSLDRCSCRFGGYSMNTTANHDYLAMDMTQLLLLLSEPP